MALPFALLVIDSFSERAVRARWFDRQLPMTSDIERLVTDSWAAAETEAAAWGRELFPGPMARLLGWSVTHGRLTLDLGPTDYREFVGTNLRHPELADQFGRDALANSLGVSIAVVTADGQFILQRRSEHVFEHPGFLHVCGGNVEPVDVAGPHAPGVFAAVRRELEEELGITATQTVDLICLGLAENRATRKPDLLFAAEVALPATAFDATRNTEYSDLVFIAGDTALTDYLIEHHRRFSPPGMACLLSLGRRRLGESWFAATTSAIEP